MSIKYLRIIGEGVDILSQIEQDPNDCGYVFLHKPTILLITNEGAGLMPYPTPGTMLMKDADAPLHILKHHILFMIDANEKVEDAYRTQVLGGISVVKKSLITL